VGEIQDMLAKHGAKKIMLEYENTNPVAISFQIDTVHGLQSIVLPSNPAGVLQAMKKDGIKANEKRGNDVAWRICKDWIEVQLAFVKAAQAEMTQVFLPYIVTESGATVYEMLKQKNLLLDVQDG
jgi:hypothetical protein